MTPVQRGVLVMAASLATTTFASFVCMVLGLENFWPGMLVAFIFGLVVFGMMTREN